MTADAIANKRCVIDGRGSPCGLGMTRRTLCGRRYMCRWVFARRQYRVVAGVTRRNRGLRVVEYQRRCPALWEFRVACFALFARRKSGCVFA